MERYSDGNNKICKINESNDYTQSGDDDVQDISSPMVRSQGRNTPKAASRREGHSSRSSHAEMLGRYASSIQMFYEKQKAVLEFEREKLERYEARKKNERNYKILDLLIRKEIAGLQLSEQEAKIKDRLLNKFDMK